ncbi:unnamed protein product [Allacma fusca]|uniref:Uncharacterized protein n=1 Tax=Allacma fusca TaxID=39272 RepID=A0A8J2KHM3_9HEXA|nr:unnamed protein product [Allacma fusca]
MSFDTKDRDERDDDIHPPSKFPDERDDDNPNDDNFPGSEDEDQLEGISEDENDDAFLNECILTRIFNIIYLRKKPSSLPLGTTLSGQMTLLQEDDGP